MNKTAKIVIVVALALVVGALLVGKRRGCLFCGRRDGGDTPVDVVQDPQEPDDSAGLPRLVDLGSTTCIPCKMMAPILEELKEDYAGRMRVEFVDVNVNREALSKYDIRIIPTQIFFDASGKELFRHEGFIAREDILAKWADLGVDLDAPASANSPTEPPGE